MRIPSLAKDLYYRVEATSKRDFGLNLLNICARTYQVGFAVYVPVSRYLQGDINTRWFYWFVVSLIYSFCYPLLPKSAPAKWAQEEIQRAKTIGVAATQIAAAISDKEFTLLDMHRVTNRMLHAIRSEVQQMLLDAQESYFNVSLLIEDGDDLVVFDRTNPDRPDNARYPKNRMVVGKAMNSRSYAYEPDFKPTPEEGTKPYRCILAFPLIIKLDGTLEVIGGLSIDSWRAHHFDGLEENIETKLLPYLGLVKLAIVFRHQIRANAQKAN